MRNPAVVAKRRRKPSPLKGRKHSPARRRAISAALAGKQRKPLTAEHKAKLAAAHTGKSPTAEHRGKIRAAHLLRLKGSGNCPHGRRPGKCARCAKDGF